MRETRRLAVILTAMVVATMVVGGAALGASPVGTGGGDTLVGHGGVDELQGLAGNDALRGDEGDDKLFGGDSSHSTLKGDDTIAGGPGDDYVEGGVGADTLSGGEGEDEVIEGPDADQSFDRISGGAGNDLVSAAGIPASKDRIDCGTGDDTVQADARDSVAKDCEKVEIFEPQTAAPRIDDRSQLVTPSGTSIGFNCITPRFGSSQCGPEFTLYRQALYIRAYSAGGNNITDFSVFWDRSGFANNEFLKGIRFFRYPNTAFLYRNSRANKRIYVNVGSPANVRVQVQGRYERRN